MKLTCTAPGRPTAGPTHLRLLHLGRGAEVIRGHTAVLVNNVLLLDRGPEVPPGGHPAPGTSPEMRYLVVTHAYPDASTPALPALPTRTGGCR